MNDRDLSTRSVAEIALILEKPEGTVKSLCSRGLENIREIMSRMQPNTE